MRACKGWQAFFKQHSDVGGKSAEYVVYIVMPYRFDEILPCWKVDCRVGLRRCSSVRGKVSVVSEVGGKRGITRDEVRCENVAVFGWQMASVDITRAINGEGSSSDQIFLDLCRRLKKKEGRIGGGLAVAERMVSAVATIETFIPHIWYSPTVVKHNIVRLSRVFICTNYNDFRTFFAFHPAHPWGACQRVIFTLSVTFGGFCARSRILWIAFGVRVFFVHFWCLPRLLLDSFSSRAVSIIFWVCSEPSEIPHSYTHRCRNKKWEHEKLYQNERIESK